MEEMEELVSDRQTKIMRRMERLRENIEFACSYEKQIKVRKEMRCIMFVLKKNENFIAILILMQDK